MIKLVDVKPYRKCSICEDGTKAVKEIEFQTGANSTQCFAVCEDHLNKLSDAAEKMAEDLKHG